MTILQLFSVLAGLEGVQRFSMTRLAVPESVLSHTGMVALTCLLIAEELTFVEENIDMEVLLRNALVHDIEEIYTGDVPRPLKYESGDELANAFHLVKDKAVTRVMKRLGLSSIADQSLTDAHKYAKSLQSKEGVIVAIADMLAVAFKTYDEVLVRGNLSLLRVVNMRRWGLTKLRQAIGDAFENKEQKFYLYALISEAESLTRQAMERGSGFDYTMAE